ncbi:NADPH-dependent 7-cyano-7-deazaguanine reductase QueF [Candidatus Poribacteria bacterium]|jgi:7-cyano-7-deazaguanine reductase|nr:NADPH-dependent 7-cyano-7-deazaguanine reductase QueF [Candidatus Poribacteria bacterium]MBT5536480.1 NADPH-dependent 7-cyano-7-deazaguanine reductase QueF [Candidatus Poribacteria bacterium]MBT7100160.1 NADPH-dependent 7-cyano-7-deazaguanine reductase QueF [Candidatus Poribacteria bacterium]MBT7806706.1 NADPH-dependent 7-cyano-7-deazaguanine reductase QueF [Candidatus Poribacteria bacterium]
MPEAEGLQLPFDGPEAVRADLLDTFPYDGVEQEIRCETDEFSAVCPFSGLPDIARLTITYTPDGRCVELKSLKYYLVSYRNVGIYQEHATDRILRDLVAALQPKRLVVETDYNIRGGIHTVCRAEHPSPSAD